METRLHELPRPRLLDGSFHHHLLVDHARLDAYAEAVRRVVREHDVVADIGSGTGVLAYLAVKAGARKVHAIEANTQSFELLLRLVRRNGLEGVVVPTLADGTQWSPPDCVDVVVCELMETALLHEPIAAVVRNVRSWPDAPRAIVPRRVDLQVEGVELRDDFMGYRVPLPGFRPIGEEDPPLTDAAVYASYDLTREAPGEEVDATVELVVKRDGRVGALQLRTLTEVAEGILLGASPAYCTPLALDLPEPVDVRAGERLRVRLQYEFSYTSQPLRYHVEKV